MSRASRPAQGSSTTFGKARLRSHLQSLPGARCRELIIELWERLPEVKDYFANQLSAEGSRAVLARAQRQIEREFSTSTLRPRGDPAVARRVIAAFRRSQVRRQAEIELLLFYVGSALDFVIAYGDERPAKSIIKTFSEALDLADREDLISKFRREIAQLVADAETVGWGVGDSLRAEWLEYEERTHHPARR